MPYLSGLAFLFISLQGRRGSFSYWPLPSYLSSNRSFPTSDAGLVFESISKASFDVGGRILYGELQMGYRFPINLSLRAN